jgi:protein-S-isoprenylcysteine O-methyltransferase Ste14
VNRLLARLRSTPARTFVLYPIAACLVSALGNRGRLLLDVRFAPLLVWGYLQYRLCGDYRQQLHAGSRGMERLPERILQSGPYALTRNPMYLGHLIFLLGLALVTRSKLAGLIFLAHVPRFHMRVLEDEARLREQFGAEYEDYCRRVKRWVPFVI